MGVRFQSYEDIPWNSPSKVESVSGKNVTAASAGGAHSLVIMAAETRTGTIAHDWLALEEGFGEMWLMLLFKWRYR